jgi:hypothetical protein
VFFFFFVEYLPDDGRKRSKHVGGLLEWHVLYPEVMPCMDLWNAINKMKWNEIAVLYDYIFVSKYCAVVGLNTAEWSLLQGTRVILNCVEYSTVNVIWFTNLWGGGGGGKVGAVLMYWFVTGEPLEWCMDHDSWDVDGSHLCLRSR